MQFLYELDNGFVKRWSIDRKPTVSVLVDGMIVDEPNQNLKEFHTEPVFELKDYTLAYQWDKLDKAMTKVKYQEKKLYCVPSSGKLKTIDIGYCEAYLQVNTWSSYKEYLIHTSRKLKVLEFDAVTWKLTKCSCWKWCKEYKCKHMIALASRKEKSFNFPIQVEDIKIGANRHRGRPRLTAAALDFQYGECVEECVYSDTESESDSPAPKKTTKRKKATKQQDSDSDYDIFADEPREVVTKKMAPAKKTIMKPAEKPLTRAAKRAKTSNN